MKSVIIFLALVAISSSKDCDYQCDSDGGCTVTYVGPPRDGEQSGSCWPDNVCSGTPNECQDCNQVVFCSPEIRTNNCEYKCDSGKEGDRGCTVRYIGPNRPGNTMGSCFPDSFGGGCSGTPRECEDCNKGIIC